MNNDLLPILSYFQKHFNFDEKDATDFQENFHLEHFKKNEIILKAGEICSKIYFVKKGLLRTFHTNQNGSEFSRLIAKEFDFCTILLSFSEKIASVATIQALEETELYSVKKVDFQELTKRSDRAKMMYTKILEDFQNFQIKRIEFLTSYSPQEKVALFLKENAELSERLTDKVIASYLQITPETYSRCKKKMES